MWYGACVFVIRPSCDLTLLIRPTFAQADAAAFAKAQGWEIDGGIVHLPLTVDNTQRPKQTVGQEGVKYSEIASLIQTLSR